MIRTLTLLAVLAVPVAGLAQGKLDQVREAVDRPATDDKNRNSSAGDSSDDDSFLAMLFSGLFTGDEPGEVGTFSPHPYADPGVSYLWLDRPHGRGAAARGSVEVGSDFDGLTRTGLRLFLDTETRFGVKTDWDYYSERRACGCRDSFWLGDVTGTYRFFQADALQMHVGLGGRFLLVHGRDRGGINLALGFDLFPGQPWHVFGSVDAGSLGSAGLFRAHGGAGVNWRHVEAFAGYDYVRIGGATLQGPFVGVRVWY